MSEQPVHQKKGMSGCIIAAITAGIIGLLLALAIGAMIYFGMGKMGEVLKEQFSANEQVVEAFGEIESAKMSLKGTGEYGAKSGNKSGVAVFNVIGTKGSGQVLALPEPGTDTFIIYSMITPSGEEVILKELKTRNDEPAVEDITLPAPAQ